MGGQHDTIIPRHYRVAANKKYRNAKYRLRTASTKLLEGKLNLALRDPNLITKTYLYKFDPLKPHFYIVKLGFTGVYIIFLISAQKT